MQKTIDFVDVAAMARVARLPTTIPIVTYMGGTSDKGL